MPVPGLQEQNDGYPNFEHLEAEGQRLLPEQLKTMLRARAQSNLLRGDARYDLFGGRRQPLLPHHAGTGSKAPPP